MDDEFDEALDNMNDNDDSDMAMSKRGIMAMLTLCFTLIIVLLIINFIFAPDFEKPEYVVEDDTNINITELTDEKNNSLIGINSATYEDLLNISGIGQTNARKILDFIEKNGTIVSFDDLLEIDGIGYKKLEQIKESCYID